MCSPSTVTTQSLSTWGQRGTFRQLSCSLGREVTFSQEETSEEEEEESRHRYSSSEFRSIQRAKRPADHETVDEARPIHSSTELAEAIYETETRSLSQDRPLELVTREMVSPVRHSISMEVDTEVSSTSRRQCVDLAQPTFADVMAGQNTLVFTPTPAGFGFNSHAHDFTRSVRDDRGRHNCYSEA